MHNPGTKAITIIEDGLVQGESVWLFGAGWGFRKLLNWVTNRYGRDLPIFCTEAGWSVSAKNSLQAKYDTGRLMYYYSYLAEAFKAITIDQVPLKGFFAWSLMDNYEWEMGYTERFGIMYNDFNYTTDTNSPGADSPVYDATAGTISKTCGLPCRLNGQPDPIYASGQTRHVKNSLLWMQSLWKSGELPDPSPLLASTVGGDVCFGRGNYTVSGQTVRCHGADDEIPFASSPQRLVVVV